MYISLELIKIVNLYLLLEKSVRQWVEAIFGSLNVTYMYVDLIRCLGRGTVSARSFLVGTLPTR